MYIGRLLVGGEVRATYQVHASSVFIRSEHDFVRFRSIQASPLLVLHASRYSHDTK